MIRTADAQWSGDLFTGGGNVKFGSGAYEGPVTFKSRFEDGGGTNPEEMIAAAHSSCFTMQLSALLGFAGHPATKVETKAKVSINKDGEGFSITQIDLIVTGDVPGIDAAAFQTFAEQAKAVCPVSKALAAVPISLEVHFV